MQFIHIDAVGEYKPGDLPPEGYNEWHEWARVQKKAGIRQERCGLCSLWRTPQEMSDSILESHNWDQYGNEVIVKSPVCLKCHAKKS